MPTSDGSLPSTGFDSLHLQFPTLTYCDINIMIELLDSANLFSTVTTTFIISASLAIRIAERSSIVTEHSSRHFRLSVRRCELWPHTWMDRDAVWDGESGRARKRCIRFWW